MCSDCGHLLTCAVKISVIFGYKVKSKSRSSCCGTIESVASWEHWDMGLIPGLAQWVGESSVAAAVAWVTTEAWIWSLVQELHMPWGGQKRKKKKEKPTKPPPPMIVVTEIDAETELDKRSGFHSFYSINWLWVPTVDFLGQDLSHLYENHVGP